ncbi:hypothetical protein BDR05DRAFT_970676 [Suillus weaverae]|nr:hypothetical protein BDR05DRAFT_970676 [Suillus weaverae]
MGWTKTLATHVAQRVGFIEPYDEFWGMFFQGYRRAEMLPARLLVMISHRVSGLDFSSDTHPTVASDGTRLFRSASL